VHRWQTSEGRYESRVESAWARVGLTEKREWIDAFEVLTVLEDRDQKSQLLTYFDAGVQSQDF
jgi:hypothetical protein